MIPIAKPMVGEAEAAAASAAVMSGWLSQGAQVAAFEAEFAALVDAPYACAVSNCTTGLHLALMAVDAGPGDEVITVSHSFIAAANVIRQCGAVPIFVDIEADGFNMDPVALAAAVTPKTKAILCVHQIGMPCDMAAIMRIARQHDLPVIEDAACAIGSRIQVDGDWLQVGAPQGDIVVFSFHPRKVITTGEGGMLTTRDPEWDALFRLWRQHGMSVSDAQRHNSSSVIFESYPVRGWNYRMTDIQAAIGREQLKRLPDIIARRRQLAENYARLLANVSNVTAPIEPDWARSNWQSYCVRLNPALDQKAVMQSMLADGIATRRGIMCIHMEESHLDAPPRHSLLRSERARDHSILLPLFYQMSDEMQEQVVASLVRATTTTARRPLALVV